MKKVLLIIMLIILFKGESEASWSDLSCKLNFGWGSYSMKIPKDISEQIKALTPFEEKIMSNYPDYFSYQFDLGFPLNNSTNLFVNYSRFSTGSFMSYKDYSGEYRYESIITGNSFGISIQNAIILSDSALKLNVIFSAGLIKSFFESKETLTVNQVSISTPFGFSEGTTYLFPSLSLTYDLIFGAIGLNIGYYNDFDGDFLTGFDNKLSWSGFRVYMNYSFQPFKIFY